MTQFFPEEAAKAYDERNSKLNPISENMHFLIRLILKDLPIHAKILCVGIGTGAEIFSLSQAFPHWNFVGVDPSLPMLEVCRQRLEQAKLMDRCQLIHGYVQNVPADEKFDAILSILVAHFIKHEERADFFSHIYARLRSGGYLVNTEISSDLDAPEFPNVLKNWESIQTLMGATPDKLASLPQQLREFLTILPPNKTEDLFRQSGIKMPIRFFQSFMITGWYGLKNED